MAFVLDASVRREEDDDPMRFTTMSVATKGEAVIRDRRVTLHGRRTNETADIPGATVSNRFARFTRGLVDALDTSAVAGAAPATLHKSLHKVSTINLVDDIEGARPKPALFRTNREVNPLDPVYPLPSAAHRPPTPPPFKRDSFDVADIEGTRPKSRTRPTVRTTSLDVSDIPGTRPKFLSEAHARPPRAILDVSDINHGGVFKTRRTTDPLNPTHVIHGVVVEDDPGTKPKPAPKEKSDPFYALTTADIEGARAGWKPSHAMGGVPEEKRRHFRNINFLGDIDGAQPGTLRRTVLTGRVTDPNLRNYPPLEGRTAAVAASAATHTVRLPSSDLLARKTADPRDAEIATLRAELVRTRARLEETTSSLGAAGGGGGGSDGPASSSSSSASSSSSSGPAAAAAAPASRLGITSAPASDRLRGRDVHPTTTVSVGVTSFGAPPKPKAVPTETMAVPESSVPRPPPRPRLGHPGSILADAAAGSRSLASSSTLGSGGGGGARTTSLASAGREALGSTRGGAASRGAEAEVSSVRDLPSY